MASPRCTGEVVTQIERSALRRGVWPGREQRKRGVSRTKLGGGAIIGRGVTFATRSGTNEASSGETTATSVRWQSRIVGVDGSCLPWSGQWQNAGSGQQQCAITYVVRSDATGTVIATMIDMIIVETAVARRALTDRLGHGNARRVNVAVVRARGRFA